MNRVPSELRLVSVVAPHFVAGFETDGIVRRTAPILAKMLGMTDDQTRRYLAGWGWTASVVNLASSTRRSR
jgi:hypothetical protein